MKPLNVLNVFLQCIIFLFLYSCTPTKYGIANQGSQTRYIAKPTYKDTSQDQETGILKATFSCQMYHTESGEEIYIFGEFDLDLQTLETMGNFKPCWL